jgi:DNA-directed RNA polymerase specialized sigma24 family protein
LTIGVGKVKALFDEAMSGTKLKARATSSLYETQRDVSVVLSQLPEKQRQIVQMVKLEGLSVHSGPAHGHD